MADGGNKKYTEEELVECLKSLNVPVNKNELRNPTKAFMITIFECLLKDLQIDITSPELITWESRRHMDDTDIYEDAQASILLAMIINYIISASPNGITVTVKDIIDPKPKRTKRILYHVLVFWNYSLHKYAKFHLVEENFEEVRKNIEDLARDNEYLDEKITEMECALKNMPPKTELESICAAKAEKLNDYRKQKEILLSEYNALKSEIINLEKQKNETSVGIVTAQEKLEELSQLILSSPERVNTEIQRLKEKFKTECDKVKEKEVITRSAEKKLYSEVEKLKDVERILSILTKRKEEFEKLRDAVRKVSGQQEIDIEEEKLNNLQEELNQKKEAREQKIQETRISLFKLKMKIESLRDVLQNNQNLKAKKIQAMENVMKLTDDVISRVRLASDCIVDIVKKSKIADAETQEKIAEHISWLEDTCKKFDADCDMIVEATKKKFSYLSKPK